MELHSPFGQEPHRLWQSTHNTFQSNDIDVNNVTEIDRAAV